MSTKPPSKSVFVGNIPYGLTEEQIVDIFSSAGKVLNFRLVYDRETGRPKGFGFAEYPDADSASSAVRNLNDYEIMNRKLRVDFSNDTGGDDDNSAQTNYQHPPPANGVSAPPTNASTLPPLPLGIDLPPGLTCPDSISRTLSTLPPQQLLDVLSQMKTLASTDPSKATELLHQAPQLSYAIFQALLLMGLVSTEALSTVVEQAAAQPAYVPPPATTAYAPPPPTQYGSTPVQSGGYSAPPPPPAAAAAPALPDTEALIAQVMAMSQDVVDSLPPAERSQIMALRQQYAR